MTLRFEVFDETGTFVYQDRHYDGLMSNLRELYEDFDSAELSGKVYLAALDRMLAAAPDLLPAHMNIASYWDDEAKPKKTLEAALRGLAVANRQIPEGFNGAIEWSHLENRAYLRLLNLALESYLALNRNRDALAMIELMLARNPADYQGVRFQLGFVASRAGDHVRAREAFAENAANYPPYYYELALSFMLTGEWVAAATAMRRGFAANPYIAEIMGGSLEPAALPIWHSGNLDEPDAAHDYIRSYGAFWRNPRDAMAFTRWLFNQPKVMVERAGILECREAMPFAPDAPTRSKIMEQERRLFAAIDDTISIAIVAKRKDPRGQAVWPWSQTQV
jgi:tetratricopeptide (TPR) repeat protein